MRHKETRVSWTPRKSISDYVGDFYGYLYFPICLVTFIAIAFIGKDDPNPGTIVMSLIIPNFYIIVFVLFIFLRKNISKLITYHHDSKINNLLNIFESQKLLENQRKETLDYLQTLRK